MLSRNDDPLTKTSEVNNQQHDEDIVLLAIADMQEKLEQLMRSHQQILERQKQLQIELQEFRQGEEQRDLDKLKRDQWVHRSIRSIKHCVQWVKQTMVFTDAKLDKIYRLLKQTRRHVVRILTYVATGTFVTDVARDIAKEVVKESILKEIEAGANQVRLVFKPIVELVNPVFGPIWEVLSSIYAAIPLKIKATIALIAIVAIIINHTVTVVSRRG